jgi:hypothetical protein
MAIEIKHAYTATGTNAENAEVGKEEWNAALSFTMSTARLVGRSTGGAGAAEEIEIGAGLTLSAGALYVNYTDPQIIGTIAEDIYTITDGAAFEIDPGNGSIQDITLTASRTPKATNFANGESITLLIKDGTAYTLTWTDATFGGSGVIWEGGTPPTLDVTNWTVVVLMKRAGQVYGKYVGTWA